MQEIKFKLVKNTIPDIPVISDLEKMAVLLKQEAELLQGLIEKRQMKRYAGQAYVHIPDGKLVMGSCLCLRCGYHWVNTTLNVTNKPTRCPLCTTKAWDKPKKYQTGRPRKIAIAARPSMLNTNFSSIS